MTLPRSRAPYSDPFGAARSFLESVEQYCRVTEDLTPSIDNRAANARGALLFDIRLAREELDSGTYPDDLVRDIQSTFVYLAMALARYTRAGLKLKTGNLRKDLKSRNDWIEHYLRALKRRRPELSDIAAAKLALKSLSKRTKYEPWKPLTSARQIVTIGKQRGVFRRLT